MSSDQRPLPEAIAEEAKRTAREVTQTPPPHAAPAAPRQALARGGTISLHTNNRATLSPAAPSGACDDLPSADEVRAKHARYLFPSVATYYDEGLVLESGQGSTVFDVDGRRYLDFFGGILTLSLGHTHPRVNAAVVAQIGRLGHVSTLYPTRSIADLAERLVGLAPGRLDKAFFTTSGTEANETAVMLAQLARGKQELIALRHGYSGRSMLGQSLTANGHYRAATTQIAAIKHAHAPYCYRCPFGLTYPSCELRCARDIEELIQTTTTGEIAGFLAEPILGVGGFIEPPAGYFEIAVGIVRKYGGLFLCDEVQTGFGRTGDAFWGIERHGVDPDIMTMAKGIANGFPLGATLATTAVAASWRAGNISTFGGNPISATAALATIDTIVDEGLQANAAARGGELRDGLLALAEKHRAIIGDVRGRGLMQALELVENEAEGDRTPAPQKARRLFEETKKRGLLIGKGGTFGNVIRIAPALTIGKADVADALQLLDEALAAVAEP
jgi:4-aminobutyrate aminotransferase-like enzyme